MFYSTFKSCNFVGDASRVVLEDLETSESDLFLGILYYASLSSLVPHHFDGVALSASLSHERHDTFHGIFRC